MDLFCLNKTVNNNFGNSPEIKSNSQILMANREILQKQNDDPLLKTYYPTYLYKPPFGYPRNVNVVFLRELARNPYVFSVIKAITDQAAETKWEIKLKPGVEEKDITQEILNSQIIMTEFFKNPNSDNESFAQLLRKLIADILILDSGCFVKVYNMKKELVQLRVIDGGAILKNPDRHGSIASRDGIILGDSYFGLGAGKGFDRKEKAYKNAIDKFEDYGYTDHAAYFQFAYGINYSVPIPYGKDEIIYMMENPSSETVYSRNSALQSAVDITLNLIYSSKASLDLFLNANIPMGIIQLAEASGDDTQNFQEKFYENQYSGFDEYGFQRKINGRLPVVGNPNVNFIPLNFKSNETQLLEIQEWFTKVLWSAFGVTASEMGFTQGDSRATDQSQTKVAAKKAVKPRLSMIANYINDQILTEFDNGEYFEFCFDEYDIEEDTKKWSLYEQKIRMGVLTPEMVAKEEGIDVTELTKYKQQNTEDNTPNDNIQNKSMNLESNNSGITDTPLVPVETKPFGTYKDFQDCLNKNSDKSNPKAYCATIQRKVEDKTSDMKLKSTYEFDNGKYVITGSSPEDILKQAVELADKVKEDSEDEDSEEINNSEDENIEDSIYTGEKEYNEDVQNVVDEVEDEEKGLKSKNLVSLPKETAVEKVIDNYYKDFDKMLKNLINNI